MINWQIALAQIGIGTSNPNKDAALEVASNTEGILITRIPLQATNSPTPLVSHVAGMIVYNTATNGVDGIAVIPGFYYNNGSKWIRLEPTTTAIGDIKNSILTTDHNGWYLLDGRNISLLPTNAQTNAASIGFGTNIPDATDRFLKGKSMSETIMSYGGNNNRVLTQANLPNVNFNGIANSSGNHSHQYEDKYHGIPENLNLITGLLGILGGILLNILNNDIGHSSLTATTSNSSVSGNHNHTATVSTGGNDDVLPLPSHMITNTFVYLGS